MSVRTDVVNLQVNINGDKARNNLNQLKTKATDLSNELKEMTKGTKEYIAKSAELSKVTSEMDALKKQMGLTALTMKELAQERRKLQALLNSKIPGTKEFKDYEDQLKKVIARQREVQAGIGGFRSYFQSISTSIKSLGIVGAAAVGFQFIASQFKNIVSGAAKLSDQLADLRRVSGLTASEAAKLNMQLSELDTRTSTEGLRNIALVAGKLGVAKEEIFDFTKAVDQLTVALGDELGNADQITTTLGKILNVFDGKVTGQNITNLGNAFVELANAGVASGGFIADFDQRLSAIAQKAGIGLGELSGLGAGIEELGGRVESSSTAIQNLLITIGKDLPAAAKAAGIGTEEFTKLYNENAAEALLRYSEGLVKNKESFAAVTNSLKDAGEEGARTVETITKLGGSADFLREKMDLGKKALQETGAITEAFRLKNETFGASLDKLGKVFNNLITNSRLTDFVQGLVQGITSLIIPSKSLTDEFKEQQTFVKKLQTDIVPLIDRYEELKNKSSLNKDEQVELNKAITAIGNTIPGAISEFDKYGRALSINAGKAREFINLQQAILKEKNRDAIKDNEDTLADLQRIAEATQRTLNSGKKVELGVSGTSSVVTALTTAEIRKAQAELEGYQERIKGIKGIIQELKGENLKVPEIKVATAGSEDLAGSGGSPTDAEKKAAEAAKKAAENNFSNLKKEAEKFYTDIQNLKKRIEKGDNPESDEIAAAKQKYQELLKKAEDYFKASAISSKKFGEEKKILEEEQQREINEILKKYLKKRFEEDSAAEYESSLANRTKYSDELKVLAANEYADGKIGKQEYENAIKQIEIDETHDRVIIAKDYSAEVKKAATDAKNFIAKEEKETTDNIIKETEARATFTKDENAAKLRRAVLTTRPGSQANVKARRAELDQQEKDEVQAAKDRYAALGIVLQENDEILLEIHAEYNQKRKDLDDQALQDTIDQVLKVNEFIVSAWASVNEIISNRENKQFAKEKALAEKKKKLFKDQLDNKLISQAQYDKKINALQEEQDAKERELKRKQAKRDKALRLYKAVIDTAAAVVTTFVSNGGWPDGIIPAAIMGVLGGLQIAAIASQPLPELGKGDWIRNGDKHSDASGGQTVKIERDEAVMSAAAMTDPNTYTISGTPAQITSRLNSQAGGISWAGGAIVQKAHWMRRAPSRIVSDAPFVMAQAGRLGSDALMQLLAKNIEVNSANLEINKAIFEASNSNLAVNNEILETGKSTLEATKAYPVKVKGEWVIKDLDYTRELYDAAKKSSSIRQ